MWRGSGAMEGLTTPNNSSRCDPVMVAGVVRPGRFRRLQFQAWCVGSGEAHHQYRPYREREGACESVVSKWVEVWHPAGATRCYSMPNGNLEHLRDRYFGRTRPRLADGHGPPGCLFLRL